MRPSPFQPIFQRVSPGTLNCIYRKKRNSPAQPTLGLAVSDAEVTLPEKAQPDFKIDALNIGIQFMPLLRGSVEIDTFALDGLDARVESSESER